MYSRSYIICHLSIELKIPQIGGPGTDLFLLNPILRLISMCDFSEENLKPRLQCHINIFYVLIKKNYIKFWPTYLAC